MHRPIMVFSEVTVSTAKWVSIQKWQRPFRQSWLYLGFFISPNFLHLPSVSQAMYDSFNKITFCLIS